jgi:CRISPR system Cascade subunit CasC
MNNSGIKIEAHLIQNFAPSNLNRDDTGQPKSATFGCFRRARISSQCTKKSTRDYWRKTGTVTLGDRTKKIQYLIKTVLQAKNQQGELIWKEGKKITDELLGEGIRVFTDAYYAAADKKKPENTSVLIFIGPSEVDVCAQAIKDLWNDIEMDVTKKGKQTKETVEGIATIATKRLAAAIKKTKSTETESKQVNSDESKDEGDEDSEDTKKEEKGVNLKPVDEIRNLIKNAQVSADIALFGRMLAEQRGRNTDGACQVAHPLSTHKVDMEMDFYTAVDDLNPAEETGAGMMGVVGFNSACYYRYALVDRDQLARNLARKTERKNGAWMLELQEEDYEETDKVIKLFLDAMVYAVPTGKQHSFAAQNLPTFGLFVRRQGGVPISLANAFAKPIRPNKNDDDVVGLSIDALTKHWDALKSVYGDQSVKKTPCFHVEQGTRLNGLTSSVKKSVKEAIDAVMDSTED